MTDESLTRDAALMWLNDRLGRTVTANVNVEITGYSVSLLEASGPLLYWREADQEASLGSMQAGLAREDIEGRYYVGSGDYAAALDLSDLPEGVSIYQRVWPLLPEDELLGASPACELRVELADDVWVSVVEPIRQES